MRERGLSDSQEETLSFLRCLKNRDELAKLIRAEATLEALTDLVWDDVTTLQNVGAATSAEVQSKFAGSTELSYGGLDSFFGGLEGVIGAPDPKLREAMAADHVKGPGTESRDEFVTGNCEARGIRTAGVVALPCRACAFECLGSPPFAHRRHPHQLQGRVAVRCRCRGDA